MTIGCPTGSLLVIIYILVIYHFAYAGKDGLF